MKKAKPSKTKSIITNGEIYAPGFKAAIEELSALPMPGALAYRVVKFAREASEQINKVDESRIAILNKYAEKDQDGNIKTEPSGKVVFIDSEAAEQAFTALLQDEATITPFITEAEVMGLKEIKPSTAFALEKLIIK